MPLVLYETSDPIFSFAKTFPIFSSIRYLALLLLHMHNSPPPPVRSLHTKLRSKKKEEKSQYASFSPSPSLYTLQMNHKNRALCKSLKRTFPSLPFPLLLPRFFAQIFVLAESRFLLPSSSSSPSLSFLCSIHENVGSWRPRGMPDPSLLFPSFLYNPPSSSSSSSSSKYVFFLGALGDWRKREREREICWGKTRWKEQERKRRRENVFFLAEKIRENERHTVFLHVLCAYDVQLRLARFYYFFRPGLFKLGFKFRGARGIRFLLPNTSLGN